MSGDKVSQGQQDFHSQSPQWITSNFRPSWANYADESACWETGYLMIRTALGMSLAWAKNMPYRQCRCRGQHNSTTISNPVIVIGAPLPLVILALLAAIGRTVDQLASIL
jgi:hypothetical protein